MYKTIYGTAKTEQKQNAKGKINQTTSLPNLKFLNLEINSECVCVNAGGLIYSDSILSQEYFRLRSQQVANLKAANESPYPHKFNVSLSLTNFIKQYDDHVQPGQILEDVVVSVAGKIEIVYFSQHRHSYIYFLLFNCVWLS